MGADILINWKKPYCPHLKGTEVKLDGEKAERNFDQCTFPIVQEYFKQYCNMTNFVNCQHFCKTHGLLKQPIEWLLKGAIETEKVVGSNDNNSLEGEEL